MCSDEGSFREVPLVPRAVAEFYAEVMQALSELGIAVRIYEMPNEIPDPIQFTEDYVHASYDGEPTGLLPRHVQRVCPSLRCHQNGQRS